MFVLTASAVWARAAAQLDLALVEVVLESIPLLRCHFAIFVSWSHSPPFLEVSLVVLDDVLIEDRDVAAERFQVEMTEQGCPDMDRKSAVGEVGGEKSPFVRSRRVQMGACGD